MGDRHAPDGSVRSADRAELVFLVLKEIWINGAGPDAVSIGQAPYLRRVSRPGGQVPKHMQSKLRSDTRQCMDLGRIGKLLLQAGRRPGLEKLAEARAGVREPPGGNFNLKAVQRPQRAIADFAFAHPYLPRHRRV